MLEYRTQGFNGYAVKYSPFFDSRIAVASAANFGLVGNGRLHILNLTAGGIVAEKWSDSLVDRQGNALLTRQSGSMCRILSSI